MSQSPGTEFEAGKKVISGARSPEAISNTRLETGGVSRPTYGTQFTAENSRVLAADSPTSRVASDLSKLEPAERRNGSAFGGFKRAAVGA